MLAAVQAGKAKVSPPPRYYSSLPQLIFNLRREKERQNKRDEQWMKVENQAAKSPAFEVIVKQQQPEIEYNHIANSPEDDGEVNIESIEHEAREVSFFCAFVKSQIFFNLTLSKRNIFSTIHCKTFPIFN